MSHAIPKPHVQLDLAGHEFKTVIRALTGALNRTGTKLEEELQARELGIRLLDQYVRGETERLRHLKGVLGHLQEPEKDAPEVVQVNPTMPEVTILRPRSGITSSAGSVLVRRSER